MASIKKYGKGFRAQVYVDGKRASKVFRTQREATAWAIAKEEELEQSPAAQKTVRQLIERYIEGVISKKKTARHEEHQALALLRDYPDLANKKLADLDTPDLALWRDGRLKVVSDGTILRNLSWLRNAFRLAREEWKWMDHDPLKGLRIPKNPSPRDRRVDVREVRAICRHLGYRAGRPPERPSQEVALAFLVALRSAMRAGEIVSLGKATLNMARSVAKVDHKTQHLTGRQREVPLTKPAIRLLRPVADRERCFTISADTLSVLFGRACKKLMIDGLHFHDSRAEALTRLSRKVDVMTLSKISGHKDVRILVNAYYRETAEQIAARL